jgi:hypothetical protein
MKALCQTDRPFADLVAILCYRQPRETAGDSERLRQLVGPRIVHAELLQQPGATVAVADPRLGGWRLLADHGAYFEFVPVDQAEHLRPPRLSVGEVRRHVPYEVAITSPAGWWACRSGLVVAFDRLAPPMIRVLECSTAPGTAGPARLLDTVRGPRSPVQDKAGGASNGACAVPSLASLGLLRGQEGPLR